MIETLAEEADGYKPDDPVTGPRRGKGADGGRGLGWSRTAVLVHWPVIGLVAAGGAGYLTYKWFMFRAKRGMRF